MRLLKGRYINLLNFTVAFDDSTGKQTYTQTTTQQILASVMPFKASMMPDFQVDLARIKDHWLVISNTEIKTDQSVVVEINGLYYLPVYSEDLTYLDPRTGYFKTIVKLNVAKGYGLGNGNS